MICRVIRIFLGLVVGSILVFQAAACQAAWNPSIEILPSPFVSKIDGNIFMILDRPVPIRLTWPLSQPFDIPPVIILKAIDYRGKQIFQTEFQQDVIRKDESFELIRIIRIPNIRSVRKMTLFAGLLDDGYTPKNPSGWIELTKIFGITRSSGFDYGDGWYEEETEENGSVFRWSSGIGELIFHGVKSPFFLCMTGQSPLDCLEDHRQILDLNYSNRHHQIVIDTPDFQFYVPIFPEGMSIDGRIEIGISAKSFSPAECHQSQDKRYLAFRIFSMSTSAFIPVDKLSENRTIPDGYITKAMQPVQLLIPHTARRVYLLGRTNIGEKTNKKEIQIQWPNGLIHTYDSSTRDFCFDFPIPEDVISTNQEVTVKITTNPIEFYMPEKGDQAGLASGFILKEMFAY